MHKHHLLLQPGDDRLLSLLPGQGCRLLSLQLLHPLHKATLLLLLPLAALLQICTALLQCCCRITRAGLCLMLPVALLQADCSGLLAVSYDCRQSILLEVPHPVLATQVKTTERWPLRQQRMLSPPRQIATAGCGKFLN